MESRTISEIIDRLSSMEVNEANKMLSSMLTRSLDLLNEAQPKSVSKMTEHFEGLLTYNNYLGEDEAMDVVAKFVNDDGTNGAHWKDPDVVFARVGETEIPADNPPYYNRWALYTTLNMIVSDYNSVLEKYTEGDADKYFTLALELAVARLKDIDNAHFVRTYFGL